MTRTWRAFAKINRDLRVLGRRGDGYHEIRTTMETVDLADRIRVSDAERFEFRSTAPPSDETNLVVRAVRAFERETGLDVRLRVELDKRIPAGMGLGGGSSDAAVTVLGLSRIYGVRLEGERLYAILGELGSDVPFFALGGRALALGRGEMLYPLPDRTEGGGDGGESEAGRGAPDDGGWLVLALPTTPVSTAEAYSWLTETYEGSTILGFCARFVPALCGSRPAPDARLNDFEAALFPRFPELAEIKAQLRSSGAREVSLTGSGAALYGEFEREDAARDAVRHLGGRCRTELVRPVSRSGYFERLFPRADD